MMNDLTAMLQARDALEGHLKTLHCAGHSNGLTEDIEKSIAALDSAIQQIEQTQSAGPEDLAVYDAIAANYTSTQSTHPADTSNEAARIDMSDDAEVEWDYNDRTVLIRRSGGDWEPATPVVIVWHLRRRAGQITEADLRAMLPDPEAELSINDRGEWCEARRNGTPFYTIDQMLAYGRAIVERMGGMK